MNKPYIRRLVSTLLLLVFPALLFADDGSLSLAPPASDYSIIFLANLFGVVDGVLHGTGSQIMGNIFGVFNSAVLVLGGIIIMYTLIVSTMNTAHEGQMLGQKWSSIWIPVRSTMGLALLIPKASGYCLMQIFVMWIVVQGVGAADKVWDAALKYLNRGGVIIQAQIRPESLLYQSGDAGITEGAMKILSGQVCMLGLQNILINLRKTYLDNELSECSGQPEPIMASFCKTPVPDFVNSVNAVKYQEDMMAKYRSENSGRGQYELGPFVLPMPNFSDPTSPYHIMNGICGEIQWNFLNALKTYSPGVGSNISTDRLSQGNVVMDSETAAIVKKNSISLSSSEFETAQLSRAIAIQQMYLNLSTIAQVMVNNNPLLSTSPNSNSGATNNYSPVAKQQFGAPYTANGQICGQYSQKCEIWGRLPSSSSNSGVLFNGTEFLGALTDYNAIMKPTLNLLSQANQGSNNAAGRSFIEKSSKEGWIMAGSYFFDLVNLNKEAADMTSANQSDTGTGLEKSIFRPGELATAFLKGGENSTSLDCSGTYKDLCYWLKGQTAKLIPLQTLIMGSKARLNNEPPIGDVPEPNLAPNTSRTMTNGQGSSTVYGFINDSLMLQLPDQPGISKFSFADTIYIKVKSQIKPLERNDDLECGAWFPWPLDICIGEYLADFFYNFLFRGIFNFFLALVGPIIKEAVMFFLQIPLKGMAEVFRSGMEMVSSAAGTNPIIALANMGVMYINFAADLWIQLLIYSITAALIPFFGKFIYALITLALPLLMAWLGIMIGVGFITAYYIPILPYMIFTFGSLAWLILVIEAMVAAPIVALGVTHPEGHDAFGKAEHAVMLLMNVFLRPAMMIIGYIFAISLSYVGIWILNTGFEHAISFIQQKPPPKNCFVIPFVDRPICDFYLIRTATNTDNGVTASGTGGYSDWAGIYAYFFSILLYTSMYLTIVQKAFTLIAYLPDKVLRWIGGTPETLGTEAAGWGEEVKGAVKDAGKETHQAQGQIGKQLGGYAEKGISKAKGMAKKAWGSQGGVSATPSDAPEEKK